LETKVKAEWERLREVLMHRPGIETFFGLMEPETFLYERHFSYEEACDEHRILETSLKQEGVRVHNLKDTILQKAEESDLFRREFIEIATKNKRFEGGTAEIERAEDRFTKSVEDGVLDLEHLFNIIVLNPVVDLGASHHCVSCKEPLANLVFMRDQQAIGDKGVIFGRMHESIRRRETELTALALKALDPSVAHFVTHKGTFEGGDFLPMKKFALIGVGPRTNMQAIEQILEKGVSYDEIGVVKCPVHPSLKETDPQVCMHLDTFLNVAGEGIVIGFRPLLARADVDIYGKASNKPVRYEKSEEMKLIDYLKREHFNVVDITCFEQLCYASNFICIEDGYILSVDTEKIANERWASLGEKVKENPDKYWKLRHEAKKDLWSLKKTGEFFPHKKQLRDYGVEHKHISVTNISGGYGAIHCLTAALSRT
jgi:arginine deiminase